VVVNQEVVTENEMKGSAPFHSAGLNSPEREPPVPQAREEILETITTELLVEQKADAIGIASRRRRWTAGSTPIEDIARASRARIFQAALGREGIVRTPSSREQAELLRQEAKQVMQYKRERAKGDDSHQRKSQGSLREEPNRLGPGPFRHHPVPPPVNAKKAMSRNSKQAAELKTKIESGGDFPHGKSIPWIP
jgi:hypothetical protein